MIKKDITLKNYSNIKTGGRASYFLEVSNIEDLINGLKEYNNLNPSVSPFILAGGTNLLINDKGYEGLIIHNKINGISSEDEIVTVGSGVLFFDLLNFCIEKELSGLEWAGGLPGTIGGAVRGNAGAFSKETKDNILSVKSINLKTLEINERTKEECNFSYRNSFFKSEGKDELIIEVKLKLEKGIGEEIKKQINEKIEYRKNRHPLEYPTLGSTFKNVLYDSLSENLKEEFKGSIKNDPFPVIPVVKFLIGAGLKGFKVGDAQLAEKHPNFVINLGEATSDDVLKLLKTAKEKVKEKYQIKIEEEIIFL